MINDRIKVTGGNVKGTDEVKAINLVIVSRKGFTTPHHELETPTVRR
ncbi:hypothetical protein [Mucilaginibacter xinganensis]|nr:hypothetical protein [Mucilaginibacter xinganensis]